MCIMMVGGACVWPGMGRCRMKMECRFMDVLSESKERETNLLFVMLKTGKENMVTG